MATPSQSYLESALPESLQPGYEFLHRHGHWMLRAVFAGVFLYHGIDKFSGGVAGFAGAVGIPAWSAYLVALTELAAGLGIIVGGLGFDGVTRLAGLAIVPVMLGAIVMLHWPRWAFSPAEGFPLGGMEFQFTLIALGLYFAVRGNDV